MNILSVENICYKVSSKREPEKEILKNISFTVPEEITLGITGESGAGKTTLAKIIAGFLSPTSGVVKLNISKSNNSSPVQLLFQNSGDILNPFRKIFDVVNEAAYIHLNDKAQAEEETKKIFKLIKLNSGLWENRGYQLSGGEQQRAALARLLAVKPRLLILDEPFAAQDIESQINLISILKEIKEEFKLTVICISHNVRLLQNFTNFLIVMRNGEITESGDVPDILQNPHHDYTKLLIKAEKYNLNQEELKSFLNR